MTLRHAFAFQMALLVAAAGAGSACRATQTSPPAGRLASDDGGIAGYQHSVERTHFRTGEQRRSVEEYGFAKVIGPAGVFATNLRNGLVVAVPSGNPDAQGKKSAKVDDSSGRSMMDPDKHNRQVVDYFVAAGVPKEQIGGVHANTYLSSRGSYSEARPAPPRIDGYASALQRKVEDIAVVDSVAWARLDDQGAVMSEWVYWPAIPAKALADAKRLRQLTAGADKARFLARLPAGLPEGTVVIRHTSATVDSPFEAFASYDVRERKTSDETAPPGRYPKNTSVVMTTVRHFDVDGVERRLPQEQRRAGPDSPKPDQKQPGAR
jgi:hypothetical protein